MEVVSYIKNKNFSFPLPIFTSVCIGEMKNKEGEKFSIFVGLDEKLVSQLKTFSLDKNDIEIQKNTSDLKRFGEGAYEDWYKKNRTPFALVNNKKNALAALVWFGPESLFSDKNDWHTAGWRSYNPYRGKGLTKDFIKFTIDVYIENVPNAKFWVAIKKENSGSVGLATNLGFQISEEYSNDVSLIMIK